MLEQHTRIVCGEVPKPAATDWMCCDSLSLQDGAIRLKGSNSNQALKSEISQMQLPPCMSSAKKLLAWEGGHTRGSSKKWSGEGARRVW